eukprot:TRINITY_DN2767_c0_g2_i1.p1 TRINITY_DN2767_c0_g2~~TRINITY_DN2767_c0_g2_i1.p1  ORF type:complete len:121 (-),score=1.66 TRINITY_DN2767_c0_g2_i1:62-424(-)
MELVPYVDDHVLYCRNMQKCLEAYKRLFQQNADFREFMNECHANPLLRGYSYGDFIHSPVGKFCMYPLLLRCLSNGIFSSTHPDYKELMQAKQWIKEHTERVTKERSRVVSKMNRNGWNG